MTPVAAVPPISTKRRVGVTPTLSTKKVAAELAFIVMVPPMETVAEANAQLRGSSLALAYASPPGHQLLSVLIPAPPLTL